METMSILMVETIQMRIVRTMKFPMIGIITEINDDEEEEYLEEESD